MAVLTKTLSSAISTVRLIAEALVMLALIAISIEMVSRVTHWGYRPAIPHVIDEYGAPRLPADIDYKIQLPNRSGHRLCTDELGIRRIDCDSQQKSSYRLLVLGDSQAMGWGMAAAHSFSAQLAKLKGIDLHEVGVAAVAGTDPESLYPWATEIAQAHGDTVEQLILFVNLGNDLDEMFLGRTSVRLNNFPKTSEWLGAHSFFYLDFTLVKQSLFGGEWSSAPGSNPVLFMIDDTEADHFSRAIADACRRLLKLWPAVEEAVVVLIPSDYQVFPEEFLKYRTFYQSDDQFQQWNDVLPRAIERLNRHEDIIARELNQSGITTVKARRFLAELDPLLTFDRTSHHLSISANGILAGVVQRHDGNSDENSF